MSYRAPTTFPAGSTRTSSEVHSRQNLSSASRAITTFTGSGTAIGLVVAALSGWVVVGFSSDFDESWHRWLHTGVAVVTLLMLFVIQHTTNRESRATLVKLDELLRTDDQARDKVMSVENASPEAQDEIEEEMVEHPTSAPD